MVISCQSVWKPKCARLLPGLQQGLDVKLTEQPWTQWPVVGTPRTQSPQPPVLSPRCHRFLDDDSRAQASCSGPPPAPTPHTAAFFLSVFTSTKIWSGGPFNTCQGFVQAGRRARPLRTSKPRAVVFPGPPWRAVALPRLPGPRSECGQKRSCATLAQPRPPTRASFHSDDGLL